MDRYHIMKHHLSGRDLGWNWQQTRNPRSLHLSLSTLSWMEQRVVTLIYNSESTAPLELWMLRKHLRLKEILTISISILKWCFDGLYVFSRSVNNYKVLTQCAFQNHHIQATVLVCKHALTALYCQALCVLMSLFAMTGAWDRCCFASITGSF